MQLSGKKIILAITGSIAAYKTPHLVRLLVKAGADVKVITTDAAAQFVTTLSLTTVSKHPVYSNISDGDSWNNHVALGRWADVMLIAPCSANTLAKMANGLCDNLVNAVYLSATCPVIIAPAMDEDMWIHASTAANVQKLHSYGNYIIPVAHGELASGLIGDGRMAEPEDIVHYLDQFFVKKNDQPLKNTRVLVTAGPTLERIDPVRYISNFSTGKMGIALAEAFADKGAQVDLVLGPSAQKIYHANINVINIQSSEEMYNECIKLFPTTDIAVMAAAVADYKPINAATEKIKKSADTFNIELTRTNDILASLGKVKVARQFLVGFALETNNELPNALQKLKTKNADMIVLNSLQDEGAGFGHDTNKITILNKNGNATALPLQTKKEAAAVIIKQILESRHAEKTA